MNQEGFTAENIICFVICFPPLRTGRTFRAEFPETVFTQKTGAFRTGLCSQEEK